MIRTINKPDKAEQKEEKLFATIPGVKVYLYGKFATFWKKKAWSEPKREEKLS